MTFASRRAAHAGDGVGMRGGGQGQGGGGKERAGIHARMLVGELCGIQAEKAAKAPHLNASQRAAAQALEAQRNRLLQFAGLLAQRARLFGGRGFVRGLAQRGEASRISFHFGRHHAGVLQAPSSACAVRPASSS